MRVDLESRAGFSEIGVKVVLGFDEIVVGGAKIVVDLQRIVAGLEKLWSVCKNTVVDFAKFWSMLWELQFNRKKLRIVL